MIDRNSLFRIDTRGRLALILGLLAAAPFIGITIAQFSVGGREITILLLALVSISALLVPADQLLMLGLYVGVFGMALGWRTIAVTPQILIVPSEVILWILAVSLLARGIIQRTTLSAYIPRFLKYLLLLTIPAIWLGLGRGNAWDSVVDYSKNLLMIVPIFFVINNLVNTLTRWHRVMFAALLVGVYLSLLSLLVMLAPEFAHALFGDQGEGLFRSQDFLRVGVPGWGVFGSLVMAPLVGIGIALWGAATAVRPKTMYLFIVMLCGLGVLASGTRGTWIGLLIGMLTYALFYPRRGLILASGLALLSLTQTQGDIVIRLQSALLPELFDSSAAERYFRGQSAVQSIQANPWFGQGFGTFPFVHSDYLQIGVDMGLPALGCFILAIGYTLLKLYQLQRAQYLNVYYKRYAEGLSVAFVILIAIFVSGGLVSLPFTIFVAWFLWAMIERFIQLVTSELASGTGA